MAAVVYYVMPAESGWVIKFGDRLFGHETVTGAMRAAVAAARSSSGNGHEAQVLVQMPDGAWNVAWASEDDYHAHPAAPVPAAE
jgi:hypothetical protein